MIEEHFLNEYAYFGNRVYMDCSTMGMQPERTLKVAREYQDNFAKNLGELKVDHATIRRNCKERLSSLIHADVEDIFFTANTTQGNNLLTSGYPFKEGDEVILGNSDFPAVWLPWAGKQRDGVKLVWVNNENGIVDAEDFIEKITQRTKVISISWAQSSSGYVTDLARLGKVCREKGIILAVDGIQAMGRLPMDVKKMEIDVLASGSFKGMLGVMGAGFCYCRKEIMNKIKPPICSGNIKLDSIDAQDGFMSIGIPAFADRSARMETGTCNNYGYALMSESVGLLLDIGMERVAEQIRQLEMYYREKLKESELDIKMLGSDDPNTWGGSISFELEPVYKDRLEEALAQEQIYAAVRNYFRVSLHFYNTNEDIDRLMDVLNRVLPHSGHINSDTENL